MATNTTESLNLVLNTEEHEVLLEILNQYLSDLRVQISDADAIEFKKGLRARKEVILSLLGKLSSN